MMNWIKELKVDALKVYVYETRAEMGVSAYGFYK